MSHRRLGKGGGWGDVDVGCLLLGVAAPLGLSLDCSRLGGFGSGRLRVAVRLMLLLVRKNGGPCNPSSVVVRELVVVLDGLTDPEGGAVSRLIRMITCWGPLLVGMSRAMLACATGGSAKL